ncbi:hypothetical protein [Agrococcus baldri]|uniref:Nuclease-related domain-containing protein n=1 Tax=Agrococcus baldri TaxID=153730 RepID=A0AA87URG5_9MICO|nr:hypothetical protein [Agrococcus baldri]GEK79723.1 hypothetical protein ABA31_10740 [Agrococcus baldri]
MTSIPRAQQGLPPRPRIFGTPGAALIGAGRSLNAQRAHQGRLGEERLSGLTRAIVDESPGMFLFHSMKLPSETGDIDQLLYAGGTFYLMDAKLWKGFDDERRVTYDVAMRDSETLVFVRDGEPFAGGDVKSPRQLTTWRRYLTEHPVRAVVVLMDPGAQVETTASSPDVLVLTALQLQAWLRSLPEGQPLHDVWVRELAGLAVDPTKPSTRPVSNGGNRRRSAKPAAPRPVASTPVPVLRPTSRPVRRPTSSRRRPRRTPADRRLAGWVATLALACAVLAWVVTPAANVLASAAVAGGLWSYALAAGAGLSGLGARLALGTAGMFLVVHLLPPLITSALTPALTPG